MPYSLSLKNISRERVLGLTVLEMLIILAALAIIVLISVPSSGPLLAKYHLRSASSEIYSGLQLAQSEAGLRSSTVVMCPSSNGNSCRRDGNWNLGWLVFTDGNGNGVAEEIEIIRSFEAPDQRIQITADGAVRTKAAFTIAGLVADNNTQSGQFRVCLSDSESRPRVISVDREGWLEKVPAGNDFCKVR